MNPVAEFESTRSVTRRTPDVFDKEKGVSADSSRTLRHQSFAFSDYSELEKINLTRVPWLSSPPWRNIGTSRVRASEAVGKLLTHFYELRNPEETLDFVSKSSLFLQWLLLLYPKVRKHFPDSKLYLEVVSDPEVEDVRLVNFIKVDCDPDEAIVRLVLCQR